MDGSNTLNNSKQGKELKRPTKCVEIVSMGMITAVGETSVETAAAVNAGISAYQQSGHFNKNYEHMIMALVPDDALPPLDDELLEQVSLTGRQRRMLQLATKAMEEALKDLPPNVTLPLMLGGPEKLAGRRSIISDNFLQYLQKQTKAPLDIESSYVLPFGRASGLYALEEAMRMLENGDQEYVMIGAMDSCLDLFLLGSLDMDDRIQATGMQDAFVPGEAACFLILKAANVSTNIKIFPPGFSEELGHRYSELPYTGDGLSSAIRESLAFNPDLKIKTVFASFNGENLCAKEWGVSLIRNGEQFHDDINIIHPADSFGDIGAAFVPVSLALISIGISRGYLSGPTLLFSSSDMAHRSAVCVSGSKGVNIDVQ